MPMSAAYCLSGLFIFLCFTVDKSLAAPVNVTIEDVLERLEVERTERLRFQTEYASLADKFTALERNVQMQRDTGLLSSKSRVSFSAVRSGSVSIYSRQTLIFDKILHNIGDAYNPMFGHFTVPVNGSYLISISITAQNGKHFSMQLMNNTAAIFYIFAGESGSNYQTGAASLVLDLVKDDVLYIQGRGSPDYIYGNAMTAFSGVLLYVS